MLLLHEGPVLRMRHLEERNGRVRTYNALIMRHDVYHSAATWIFCRFFCVFFLIPEKIQLRRFFFPLQFKNRVANIFQMMEILNTKMAEFQSLRILSQR